MRFVTPALAIVAILLALANFWLEWRRTPPGGSVFAPAASPNLHNQIMGEAVRFPIDGLSDSVFLVLVEGVKVRNRYGSATAFLVDQKCGIFATNAHVALTVNADTRVVLRQPGSDVELKVTATKVHPAFLRMRQIFDEFGPVLEFRRIKNGEDFENTIPGVQFDVALLYTQTNPGDPNCVLPPGVALPKALRLAAAQTLASVKPGDAIGVIGYPGTGNFSADLAPIAALPRIDFGAIRAIGSNMPPAKAGPKSHTVLDDVIFHSAATIGGSSGSPIIGTSGEVIAIHARGIGGEGANGRVYQEGAAENVNAIRQLLDGTAEKDLPAIDATIQKRLEGYLPISAYSRKGAIANIEDTAKNFGLQEVIGQSTITPLTFGDQAADGCVSPNLNCVPADRVTGGALEEARFAVLDAEIDTAKINVVSAIDYDQDVDLSAASSVAKKKLEDQRGISYLCPLMIVQLEQGAKPDEYMLARQSALETFSSILVPAANKGIRKLKLIVIRPTFCSSAYQTAQLVVTPFELRPGPRANQNVSMLQELSGALADAANRLGDAVLPADWRAPDTSHAMPARR